jgi:iron complex transport system substrate-binding protein
MVERTGDDGAAPTRRDYLTYGGALVGGGLLAGCASDGDAGGDATDTEGQSAAETEPADPADTPTATPEPTEPPETATATAADPTYTVEMAPVGEVTFESVPETWESYFPGYADMGVALGQADGLTAVGFKSRYHTGYYDELDGVAVDKSAVTQLYDDGIDAELYFELDNDVHLTDPQWLLKNSFFGLDESDLAEVRDSVGPFVGNTVFRRTDPWHDYRYYSMYEAFEKVAAVFGEQERYAAFASLHDDFRARIQADLPSADERPAGLLCFAASNEPEAFSPYRLTDKGTNKKHFHDLGVADALAGTGIEGLSTDDRGQIDYETLLEVDPETLFVRGHEGKSRAEFEDTVLAYMRDHGVASGLTAVENGDVYRGGPIYQGPVQNLFITERFATLLYPDTFGGDLFDRQRVSDIVNGDI